MKNKQPLIAILLCVYNGEKYLKQQLDSFASQLHQNWILHISIDAADDQSGLIINQFQELYPSKVFLYQGPKKGYVANFMSLICNNEIEAEFYAFADQDDIWLPNKLTKALSFLDSQAADLPALYCARTKLIDNDGREIGYSPLFLKKPSFKNALVQNIAGGNTMMLNKKARNLIAIAGNDHVIVSHDWWVYQLVSGAGGVVFYDLDTTILYRQHGENLIGSSLGVGAQISRLRAMLHGRFKKWTDDNVTALQSIDYLFSPSNQKTLALFAKSRKRSFFPRILGLKKSGIYRQTMLSNFVLLIAACVGKV